MGGMQEVVERSASDELRHDTDRPTLIPMIIQILVCDYNDNPLYLLLLVLCVQ